MDPVRADLHVHSCVSPCGSLASSPLALVQAAAARGLGVLALTDHNTALNTPAFCRLARAAGILPVPGMELTTIEEVHVVMLFADAPTALEFGDFVYGGLPEVIHDPERFGDQVYVDEDENILGTVEKSLFGASQLSLDEACTQAHARGGLCIPAHVDRTVNSIMSQLGFVPDVDFDALELTGESPPPMPRPTPLIAASDAHMPEHVGRRCVELPGRIRDFEELAEAIRSGLARRVLV